MLAKKQLGLAAERLADVVVEVREQQQVRRDLVQVAQLQPLTGERVHQRVGARIGDHAPHLRFEHARRAQPAGDRQVQQLVVGNAAPEEERQPARQLEIGDAMRRRRREAPAGSLLRAEQERRTGENPREAGANAGVEVAARGRAPRGRSASGASMSVFVDRPAERAPRHRRTGSARRMALPAPPIVGVQTNRRFRDVRLAHAGGVVRALR